MALRPRFSSSLPLAILVLCFTKRDSSKHPFIIVGVSYNPRVKNHVPLPVQFIYATASVCTEADGVMRSLHPVIGLL